MATFKKIGKKGQEYWTVVFDLPGHVPRKQKRLSGFRTRSEANLAHVAYLTNYKPPNEKLEKDSFVKIYDGYKKQLKHSVKESTYINIEGCFNNHILPYFSNKKITDIKTQDITDWIVSLEEKLCQSPGAERKLSFESKMKIKSCLSKFLDFCVDNELMSNNPCHKALKIKNTELKKEVSIWSSEEFTQFISLVDNLLYKTFFSFLYLTGCRRGEALALTWDDIKADNIVKINKTLGYHTKESVYKITTPKNSFSIREIILPNILTELLMQLKEYYKGFELFSESNFVFGNLSPLPAENIRRFLKTHCEKANVKLIRIHDFRHSHASLLISKGHDIVTIARRLGHADIEMTLNRYAHLMPNKQNELMSSLNILPKL